MKLLPIILIIFIYGCAQKEIHLLHYNIKELDSLKINQGLKNQQIINIKKILSNHPIDILSINELQYDKVDIPVKGLNTSGDNFKQFLTLIDKDDLIYHSFHEARTGKNALKKNDQNYYQNTNNNRARKNADPVNFGIFPGQYSTAGASRFPVKKEIIINDLQWKHFNPSIKISNFKDSNGKSLPESMPLFDKNFSHLTLDIDNKELHLILLHAVPSYHFGNKYSPNYKRNRDQLRFLEWYIAGSTDFDVQIKNYKPLPKNVHYIVMGDLNSDIDSSQESAQVLKRIQSKSKIWTSTLSYTNEGAGYSPKRFKANLDYIFTSKNIKILEGLILRPKEKRLFLGCDKDKIPRDLQNSKTLLVSYKQNKRDCFLSVDKLYDLYKKSSDHYPIYAKIILD